MDRAWSIEESEYRTTRGLLWRTWFAEWIGAARYLSVRQLIHSRLLVESFADESGGIHSRLYEDLEVQVRHPQYSISVVSGVRYATLGHKYGKPEQDRNSLVSPSSLSLYSPHLFCPLNVEAAKTSRSQGKGKGQRERERQQQSPVGRAERCSGEAARKVSLAYQAQGQESNSVFTVERRAVSLIYLQG